MKIELQRALIPETIGEEVRCGICGDAFRWESVIAWAHTDRNEEIGALCPACVEVMGNYRPERFPTLEELEAAKRLYPGAVWSSSDEASAHERTEAGEKAYWSSWLSRSELAAS